MRAVAATKAGRVFFRPTAHRMDQLVSKLAGERTFARIAAGLPAVILTTIGAKSGRHRTVVLMGIRIPTAWPSWTNYGDVKQPGWYHNLKAHPAATVTIDGDTWDATARIATPGEREKISAKGVECSLASPKSGHGPVTARSRPLSYEEGLTLVPPPSP